MTEYTSTYDPETDFLTVESVEPVEYDHTEVLDEIGVNLGPDGDLKSCEIINASQVLGIEPEELGSIDTADIKMEQREGSTTLRITIAYGGEEKEVRYGTPVPEEAFA